MKRLSYLLCALTLLFCGCDEIDYADRFEEVEPIITSRNVLIEEFTGQRCINCPNAAKEIQAIQAKYFGKQVIAVAIHGGSMAYSEEKYPKFGLANATGELYNNHWNVERWPAGLINRKNGVNSDIGLWQDLILKELSIEPNASITVSATYDKDTKQATVNTSVGLSAPGTAKLQLWVVENDIKTYQIEQEDYVHHHVFRAAINGDWGEEISIADNKSLNFTHKFTLKDNWNTNNLSIIAFVYTEQDGVLQAIEEKLATTLESSKQ